ncbi:cytochrome c [Ralstonia sp. RL]|uniref:c-type cytochrome n=1 Tax=Ralstonia sp. RL TaxID=1839756 RepID=UPI00257A7056|nr:cytochrome c [Ralstonia sp. RL]
MILKMRIGKANIEKLSRASLVLATIAVALLAAGFSSGVYAADHIKGRELYDRNCSVCHGPTGQSVMPGAPNLARGEGMLKPDFTLLASIRAGRNAMPAYQGILSDRDIMDVIAYVRTLH